MGVYPFMYGSIKDFQPIADRLIAVRTRHLWCQKSFLTFSSLQKDMRQPYDWDAYAEEFFPSAERLVNAANVAAEAGEKEKAAEFFLYDLQYQPTCLPH